MLDVVADVVDALRGQRMRAQIRILPVPGKHLLALEDLEELKQPARRLAAASRKVIAAWSAEASCVIEYCMKARSATPWAPSKAAAAPAAPASDRGAGGEHHRDDPFDAGVPCRLLKARQVPPGNMAGLVRKHPDQLVRSFGAHDQSGVDEFVLAAGDEGIDLFVFDEIDVQRARLESRRLPDRGHHRPYVGLDLGIANDALGRSRGLSNDERRREADCRA